MVSYCAYGSRFQQIKGSVYTMCISINLLRAVIKVPLLSDDSGTLIRCFRKTDHCAGIGGRKVKSRNLP